MQRTVWDRKRIDVATNLESADWEGDDAPTNVALPAFAKATTGFWKGVVVGVGASALLAGVSSVGGAVIVVAVYGLPTLPAGSESAIARTDEPKVEVVREVVDEPVVAAVVKPVAAPAPVVAKVEPPVVAKVEPPVVAKVEPRPAAKVAKPESTRAPVVSAPVVKVIATPAPVAKVIATPAPVALPVEPPRPNRDELLQLALAAKQTRAAAPVATPAPVPKPAAPAPKWEEPEETADLTAADDKWMPVDDTETTSSPAKSKSTGSDDDLFVE